MKRAPPPEVWRLKFRDSPAHWSDDPPLAKYAYAATRYVPETTLREEKKRLREQVADLKARLKAQVDLAAFVGTNRVYTPEHDAAWDLAERALNLKLKSWRKGGK